MTADCLLRVSSVLCVLGTTHYLLRSGLLRGYGEHPEAERVDCVRTGTERVVAIKRYCQARMGYLGDGMFVGMRSVSALQVLNDVGKVPALLLVPALRFKQIKGQHCWFSLI